MSTQKGKQSAAGKGKKGGKAGGEGKGDEVLQAVILTDSFQDRFKPLSIETPRCLLPLANVPLIEYTLEFLSMNGVQEVYLYCGPHTEEVEAYISKSRWALGSRTSPFHIIQFVRVADANSAGDILRDLDKRSIISGDFVLVHGDLVSNISLQPILEAHRKRREANADNIMTVVLKAPALPPPDENPGHHPVYVVDTKTKRCLQYDEIHPLQSEHYAILDPTVLDELSADFEVRADLIDPQIDICTPAALALWSDSFDYEMPRRDFLNGVLKDWELNGKCIYAEIIEEGYAARATSLPMYESAYELTRGGNYLELDVTLANDALIAGSVIARKSAVGDGSTILNTIIGRNCKIGKNVKITDSFIWDGTTIGDNTTVTRSILAGAGATIGNNCTVEEGCVLSYGVVTGDGITIEKNALISKVDDGGLQVSPDTALLGASAQGARFIDPEEDELDEEDPSALQRRLIYSIEHLSFSNSSISTLASDDDDSDDGGSRPDTPSGLTSRSRLSSFASDDSSGRATFHADAVNGLLDALRDPTSDFDSAKMEFLGLRLANDASESAVRKAVAVTLARRSAELVESGLEASKAAESALRSCKGVSKFVEEVGVGESDSDQLEFAVALQRAVAGIRSLEPGKGGLLLAAMLQQLYALDILEEDGILAWWADERAISGSNMEIIKEKCRALVEWLENAEEEDDSDDDDEDDDDDE
ncbi:unnamed protein product [Parascedosporium putredinis]|uniref:Translation initiation factor eIF2B subunit epsilon n=1 Tax=Parascedosporium putredinis TaxID=1442378 RepID=A0A9P1H9V2_9PEZI|nr:unnamed protein product [Parascedosporium putredinis]CAI8003967.1 unnamed protein product [Parascedosporium putredinis]